MVEARALKNHFGPVVAVDGIDFEVHRGEVFGFLGPNGARRDRAGRHGATTDRVSARRPPAELLILDEPTSGLDPLLQYEFQQLVREAADIEFHVSGPADASVFAGLEEIVSLTTLANAVQVVVEGSVDRVLKAAARLDIRRIITHEADLEEVFLGYYRDELS